MTDNYQKMCELYEFHTDDFKKWNQRKAINALNNIFYSDENHDGYSVYSKIDEIDVMDVIYYILKYSKGTSAPTCVELEKMATTLTQLRLEDNSTPTKYYAIYNGSMCDIHLFYMTDEMFNKYNTFLLNKYGFDNYMLYFFSKFSITHPSLIFTLKDIMAYCHTYRQEFSEYLYNCAIRFIDNFSISIHKLNLDDRVNFSKCIFKHPFIKLSNDEYIFFYHWFRTSYFSNIHYLLDKSEEYKKNKGETFENTTHSLLLHHFPNENIYRNIKYKNGEIDLLVETSDSYLFIECKSAILYDDYKLGIFDDRVLKNIESVTLKAKEQLIRAQNFFITQKRFMHNSKEIKYDSNKKILLLNVCFEFPVGIANKEPTSKVISINLTDLMMIIDEIESPFINNHNTTSLIDFLKIRELVLGFETDNELAIMIAILYFKNFNKFIENEMHMTTKINSDETISKINEYYGWLCDAKIFRNPNDLQLIQKNYNGFLKNYILNTR